MRRSHSLSRTLAAWSLMVVVPGACAAPPAAPIESTQASTEAPVPAVEQTERAAAETSAPSETLPPEAGTPPGFPSKWWAIPWWWRS
jgi:hypothetical protein